ncbi:MAG TPA: succinate dehydrogenase flavoprotein subunit [bacterium]|jgi:succinate dehydrogenase / fumarate reductase flavoprotein subunit|nr:succinate dehydrogenase flavoprotein subunit [bacterium]
MSKYIVVGGGLAGLMATIKLAEAGQDVLLFSIVPVKRSHSVCAQGGINAAVNIKGENDSPEIHTYDTIKGGDFLAEQPPVKEMCYAAPSIIYMFDRMGVAFSRTPEGNLDFRRFGGTLYHRTAFAGATTGQQLLYALDEQVRRWEAEGRVKKFEGWEALSVVQDDAGACRGLCAVHLSSLRVQTFPGDAVILASGGPGQIYRQSTHSMVNTGSIMSSVFQQGALFGNPEMIQIHPTAIPGNDKLRLMSESARGEGGRVWVPKTKGDKRGPKEIPEAERWYFLEEKYPVFKNLVPRDVASREIFHAVVDLGMGVGGGMAAYLDLTHIDKATLNRKLGGILEIYEKFTGEDPREVPMKVFPAMHYSMGGLWVDYEAKADGFLNRQSPRNQSTNIAGLYAIGECDYQYHGANRLGANSLLSCVFSGQLVAPAVQSYAKNLKAGEASGAVFEAERKRWEDRLSGIGRMQGRENPYALHRELGHLMVNDVSIVRENGRLKQALAKIAEFRERWNQVACVDENAWYNHPKLFINQLYNMLVAAEAITLGALERDESRGAHYKPAFPTRDDSKYMRTTLAQWTGQNVKLSFKDIDTSLYKPVTRHYD